MLVISVRCFGFEFSWRWMRGIRKTEWYSELVGGGAEGEGEGGGGGGERGAGGLRDNPGGWWANFQALHWWSHTSVPEPPTKARTSIRAVAQCVTSLLMLGGGCWYRGMRSHEVNTNTHSQWQLWMSHTDCYLLLSCHWNQLFPSQWWRLPACSKHPPAERLTHSKRRNGSDGWMEETTEYIHILPYTI